MKYSERETIEAGLRFKTSSGPVVETTGVSKHIEPVALYVHEVVILEDPGKGNTFLHNLDSAEPLSPANASTPAG